MIVTGVRPWICKECFVKVLETVNPFSLFAKGVIVMVITQHHIQFCNRTKKLNFSTQKVKGQRSVHTGIMVVCVCWTHKVYPLVKVKGHQSMMNTISMTQTQLGIVYLEPRSRETKSGTESLGSRLGIVSPSNLD